MTREYIIVAIVPIAINKPNNYFCVEFVVAAAASHSHPLCALSQFAGGGLCNIHLFVHISASNGIYTNKRNDFLFVQLQSVFPDIIQTILICAKQTGKNGRARRAT